MDGEIPHCLRNHTIVDITLTPMTVQDFLGYIQFNFKDLVKEFTIICPDFQNKLLWRNEKSMVEQFVTDVIFTVGPESGGIVKTNRDKEWKYTFFTKPDEGRKLTGTAIVRTSASSHVQPKTKDGTLILSLKHAMLLATYKLVDILEPALADGVILMTPLASLCFKKDDLNKICIDCHIEPNDENKAKVLASINQSCQKDGQYLPYSECHIAVVFALVTTKTFNDPQRPYQKVRKILREYIECKKRLDKAKYEVFSKYAIDGGIPTDFAPETLPTTIKPS